MNGWYGQKFNFQRQKLNFCLYTTHFRGHKKTKQNKKYTVHQMIKDYLKKN